MSKEQIWPWRSVKTASGRYQSIVIFREKKEIPPQKKITVIALHGGQ